MADVTQLTLAVDSRQVRTATNDLDRFGKAGQKVERSTVSLGAAFARLGPAIGVAVAALSARDVIQTADAYTQLNARLRLVTASATEFAQAQRSIFDISQRTRVSIGATADLYGNLARSTESLGVSQEELFRVTESINQALQVSGASAQAASAALTQLGQGFASGVLRGEELNSILEQTPRLARAIADGLGVPIGRLRELGQQGELTAERIFQALQRSGAQLQQEFNSLPPTVDGALQQVGNSLSRLIGQINEATGATSGLARGLSALSRGIDSLSDLPSKVRVGVLATELNDAKRQLDDLRAAANVPFGNLIPNLDQRIAAAEQRFEQARRNFRIADGRLGVGSVDDQSAAETRRLQGTAPRSNLPSLIPDRKATETGRRAATAQREAVSEAQRYLEALQQQLQATEDLSVEETLLRDIQSGRLGRVTAQQEIELQSLAAQIDAARTRIQQEQDLTREIERQAQAEQQAAKAAQDRLQAFIDATPTGQLRIQNEELDFLKEALDRNKISLEQYAEIVRTRFVEGSTAIKEQKSLVDELGLTFTSAFEDAITSGKGFSGILKGIEQDLIRIATRKLVTEPLGNLFSSFFGSGGAGGSFLSSIGGGIQNFVSGFGGGTAASIFGRAIGGPVSAGGLYRVNERGPELLNAGGNQYLMMGSQGGRVDPNVSAANSQNININVQVPQGATRETGLQFGRVIAQQLNIANARNG